MRTIQIWQRWLWPFLALLSKSVCVRNPAPVFAADIMHNVTAIKGDDVEFRCRVTDRGRHMIAFIRAEDPPRLIAFDDRVFRQREKYEVIRRPSHDEWILKIRNVQESDIGGYICQLNSNPVLTTTAFLNLKIPPIVSRSMPSAVEVREGHNVTLKCLAHGSPPPAVIWRRADRQIIRYNGATGFGASVVNGTELHLTKISRKHMAEYVCVASNGIPPDESWTIKLHVMFAPIVIPQAPVIEARVHSLVRIVCNVEAWPRALVTWYLDDLEISDNRYSTEQAVAEKYKSVHVLEAKDIQHDQFGVYKCIAANDYGKHYAEIRLVEAPWQETNSILLAENSGMEPDNELDTDDLTESSNRRRSQPIDHSLTSPEHRQTSSSATFHFNFFTLFCACFLFAFSK